MTSAVFPKTALKAWWREKEKAAAAASRSVGTAVYGGLRTARPGKRHPTLRHFCFAERGTFQNGCNRFVIAGDKIKEVDLQEAVDLPIGAFEWLHFDRVRPETRRWLEEQAGLERLLVEALLTEGGRQRCSLFSGGILLNLRGINLNEGMKPDDMISLRLWVTEERVISLRRYRIEAINDTLDEMTDGRLPRSPHDLVNRFAWHLAAHIFDALDNLNEELDTIEETIIAALQRASRRRMTEVRRQAIVLRRYLAPQRDALGRWMEFLGTLKHYVEREQARETIDVVQRFVEDLDAFRDRTSVVQDEFHVRLSDRLNRNMFILAIITAFFLPPSFVTGLLAVNLSGIPYSEETWAFSVLCLGLSVVVILQILILRRLKWTRIR